MIDARKILSDAKDAIASRNAGEIRGQSVRLKRPASPAGQVVRHIVVFNKKMGLTRMSQLVQSSGGVVTKDLRLINAVAVAMPKARAQGFVRSLSALPDVKRIDDDFYQNWLVAAPAAVESRAAAPALPAAFPWSRHKKAEEPKEQKVPWGIDRVNAKKAWPTTRGAGVKIAVIDTGIDIKHPDLKVTGGHNAIDPAASFTDDNGHGTHVAGTIAALDNTEGVVGVAPDAELYAVKVLDADGSGTFADVIGGIQWCAENGIQAANMSLGASQGSQSLQEAVAAAVKAGTAIIAAAGNSGGSVSFPGAYPEAIAVAASDSKGKVASFSSRGPEVDLIAPGVAVPSTYMGGGYEDLSGTSMATPHITGLAALALAAKKPGDVAELRKLLQDAATPFPDTPAEQQGSGLVDAERLVAQ